MNYFNQFTDLTNAPGGTRTHDPRLRRAGPARSGHLQSSPLRSKVSEVLAMFCGRLPRRSDAPPSFPKRKAQTRHKFRAALPDLGEPLFPCPLWSPSDLAAFQRVR